MNVLKFDTDSCDFFLVERKNKNCGRVQERDKGRRGWRLRLVASGTWYDRTRSMSQQLSGIKLTRKAVKIMADKHDEMLKQTD